MHFSQKKGACGRQRMEKCVFSPKSYFFAKKRLRPPEDGKKYIFHQKKCACGKPDTRLFFQFPNTSACGSKIDQFHDHFTYIIWIYNYPISDMRIVVIDFQCFERMYCICYLSDDFFPPANGSFFYFIQVFISSARKLIN